MYIFHSSFTLSSKYSLGSTSDLPSSGPSHRVRTVRAKVMNVPEWVPSAQLPDSSCPGSSEYPTRAHKGLFPCLIMRAGLTVRGTHRFPRWCLGGADRVQGASSGTHTPVWETPPCVGRRGTRGLRPVPLNQHRTLSWSRIRNPDLMS